MMAAHEVSMKMSPPVVNSASMLLLLFLLVCQAVDVFVRLAERHLVDARVTTHFGGAALAPSIGDGDIQEQDYQRLLLIKAVGAEAYALASSFNLNIKKRIIMMNKNKTRKSRLMWLLLLIPMLGMTSVLFARTEKAVNLDDKLRFTQSNVEMSFRLPEPMIDYSSGSSASTRTSSSASARTVPPPPAAVTRAEYIRVIGDDEEITDHFSFKEVTLLAIATSIDAFAVGITIALLKDPLMISSAIIGIVAFAFSIAGIFIGKKIGDYVGDKFQILGGVILILIGFKILLGF